MNIFVFDIDGTIADVSHRIHHLNNAEGKQKNWNAFFDAQKDDTVILGMWELIVSLSFSHSNKIIFQTGRPEKYRIMTGEWLKSVGLANHFDVLLMRQNNDFSPNHLLKLRFLEWIKDTYGSSAPTLWFEDAVPVLEAITRQGVTAISLQHASILSTQQQEDILFHEKTV